MITFVRTADIRDGKAQPAIEWALKVAAYLNETLQTNVAVQRNVAGPVNQLHWFSTHDSLASVEEIGAKIQVDAGYQQLLAESNEDPLFFANSVVDNLYQSIP
jgi:hypothetical protein